MSFIEWRDVFDDKFQDYPDTWSLNQAHRNNKRLFNQLQTQNCFTQTRYARFDCHDALFLSYYLRFRLDFIVQNVSMLGHQLKLKWIYIIRSLINVLVKSHCDSMVKNVENAHKKRSITLTPNLRSMLSRK